MGSEPETPTRGAVVNAVLMATLIGAFIRAVHVVPVDFPLNDGGLFFAMTRDLVANGFAIPATTSYNGADIPFLYPPLGFYLAGIVSLTGMDLFTVFRFVPLIVSILTIPAVYLLGTVALPSRFAALLATVAFAVVPRSFEWLIAGGGLTRGLGMLFAILTLWAALRLERQPSARRVVVLGVLAALTALSHPAAVAITGIWLVVILVTARARRGRLFARFLGAATVAIVAVSPWLLDMLITHGVAGILGAAQSGSNLAASIQHLLGFDVTGEPYVTLIGVFALLGIVVRASSRDWRLALWMSVILIDPRSGPTYVAPIVACAAAIALTEIIVPRLGARDLASGMVWPDASIGGAARLTLAGVLVLGVAGAIAARTAPLTPLFALPQDTRAAMVAVADVTPPDARIIVVGGTGWWVDATAEWFPVLAGRQSVATVQGAEWLGKGTWEPAVDRHVELQVCAQESVECFAAWRAEYAPAAGFVFLPRGVPGFSESGAECCPALRDALPLSGYRVVFDQPGGTLLAVPGG
ncbi:MAG: glycosyltransferase family 39 protein [Chloroflexota bacterium]